MLTFFRINSKNSCITNSLSFAKHKTKQLPKKSIRLLSKNLTLARIRLRVMKWPRLSRLSITSVLVNSSQRIFFSTVSNTSQLLLFCAVQQQLLQPATKIQRNGCQILYLPSTKSCEKISIQTSQSTTNAAEISNIYANLPSSNLSILIKC